MDFIFLFEYAESLQRHRDGGLCDSLHLWGVGGGLAWVAQEIQEFENREDTWDQHAFDLFGPESGMLISEISERQQNKSDLREETLI